jgi:glutamyl-tRNA synthetase
MAYDEKAVRKHVTPEVLNLIGGLQHKLAQLSDWSAPGIHAVINAHATESQVPLGKLAQPVRLAVCGGTISPPIDATLAILGKDESLFRLGAAMARWGA